MFKLLRYFSVTSLIAFAIVTALLAYFYRRSAVEDLMMVAQSKNVALTQTFANSLWPEFSSFVRSSSGMSGDELRAEDGVELMDYLHRRGDYADADRSPRPGLILLDLNRPGRSRKRGASGFFPKPLCVEETPQRPSGSEEAPERPGKSLPRERQGLGGTP